MLYQCNCMYIPDVCYNYLVEARIKAENHPKAKTPVPPALAQALTEMLRMQFEHLRRNEVEMMIKHLQVFDFQTHQVGGNNAFGVQWLWLRSLFASQAWNVRRNLLIGTVSRKRNLG